MLSSMRVWGCLALFVAGCGSAGTMTDDAGAGGDAASDTGAADAGGDLGAATDSGAATDAGVTPCTGTPTECAATREANAVARLAAITGDPVQLAAFLRAVPKGGDLHNHLTGAVWAETYLDWAERDGDCIQPASHTVVYTSSCSASTMPVPTSGAFYDEIVRAWSMQDFVAGAETGHDHFFATFAKYGAVAGAHHHEDVADVADRAATENELYVETMLNLGKNVGTLAASVWTGTLTAADIPAFYTSLTTNAGFAAAVASDTAAVETEATGWRTSAGCSAGSPPPACGVEVRFIAQVSRTGANDQVFGQLVSAYEMARGTPVIVAANLSSPEDDSRSLASYSLQMAMLDFLHTQYTVPGTSPLHVTLHAGELTRAFLPAGSTDDTFHIRAAVETGHAERIGHGLDVLSETGSATLLDEMRDRKVLVEVCLSSNDQILQVNGAAHPLATYLMHGVPVALATDDQGVSRSSMAGEYQRAVLDQHLDYRQLKAMARQSLEHAFLPGASLWTDVTLATPVAACTPLADAPSAACTAFLATSERATLQETLERRFLDFESRIPAP